MPRTTHTYLGLGQASHFILFSCGKMFAAQKEEAQQSMHPGHPFADFPSDIIRLVLSYKHSAEAFDKWDRAKEEARDLLQYTTHQKLVVSLRPRRPRRSTFGKWKQDVTEAWCTRRRAGVGGQAPNRRDAHRRSIDHSLPTPEGTARGRYFFIGHLLW